MTDKVSAKEIEGVVGVNRHATEHWAKAVSTEARVYVLHSQECKNRYSDLRQCPYSLALDRGIDERDWVEDDPTAVGLWAGRLLPMQTAKERRIAEVNAEYKESLITLFNNTLAMMSKWQFDAAFAGTLANRDSKIRAIEAESE